MKRGALATASAAVLCCASLALAQQPSAQPAGSAAPPATAAPNAKPAPPPAPEARPTPPPGHGQMGQEQITDRVVPDKSLAPGTVAVMIIDGNHRPVPNTDIELAILFSSVTKGESKESVKARTDEKGQYTFTGLKFGSGISYRVKTTNGPATYSSQPFGLNDQGGMRVLQHRYEAVSNIAESRLLLEVHMILDVKQDNIAINHLLVAVNLGREAYVASGLSIPLPKGYEAFSAQESTDGITIKDKDGMMVLDGTFPPGQRQLTYRYQMPLEGGDELGLKLPMPPRVAASRVVLKANEQMTLEVGGFPPAERGRWNDGAKVHEARSKAPNTIEEIQAAFGRNTPTTVDIKIKGIPTPGLKRTIAVLLALLAVGFGAFHVFRQREQKGLADDALEDLEQAKTTLLGEIALLEKLRNKGEIGPRTYKSLRTQLLDALARIMARLEAANQRPRTDADVEDDPPKKKRKKRKKRRRRAAAT